MVYNTQRYFFLVFSSLLLVISCGTEPDNGEYEINPNIIKLIDCCDRNDEKYVSGDFYLGVKSAEDLIITGPISKFSFDDDYNLVAKQELWRNLIEKFDDPFGTGFYFTISDSNQSLLFVKSEFGDVSIGSLYEYDLATEELFQIQDSSLVSSTVYWHGDDSKLVYYSYGNNEGLDAGYYLHYKTTGTDSLLVPHLSPFGPSEMLNGFDLSPDNSTLLIPYVRASQAEFLPPQVIEYDLTTGQSDTLDVEFDLSFNRVGLWLRYSPDGTQILYSNFPTGSFTETTNDDSEMGIIDRQTGERRVLDANTNPTGSQQSVQLAPTWSPDGNHIIYGSAPVFFPSGAKGSYSLYVLRNVDDPVNYK